MNGQSTYQPESITSVDIRAHIPGLNRLTPSPDTCTSRKTTKSGEDQNTVKSISQYMHHRIPNPVQNTKRHTQTDQHTNQQHQ